MCAFEAIKMMSSDWWSVH